MSRAEDHRVHVPRRPWLLRTVSQVVALEVAVLLAVIFVLRGSTLGILLGGTLAIGVLLLAVPFVGGRSLVSWIRLRMAYGTRAAYEVSPGRVPDDLMPLAEWLPRLSVSQTRSGRGEDIGIISDGEGWAAVVEIESDSDLLADDVDEVDLDALAGLTIADDIVFAGIQMVTYTVPAPTSLLLGTQSPAARSYHEVLTELPPAVRRSWLCLRLDPSRCLTAVTRRGAGAEGVHASLRFGLHRLQSALKRQGIDTKVLAPADLYAAMALACGTDPNPHRGARSEEHWEHWECDQLVHSGQRVTADSGNSSQSYAAMLAAVAKAPVLFALTSYTLEPSGKASGAVRLVTPNTQTAPAAIDFVNDELHGEVTLAAAGGVQVPAMLATIPLGRGF